jgi:hypothetical protein
MIAILDLLRTGCPWRYLSRDALQHLLQVPAQWCLGGELGGALRERMRRETSPSAAVLDSQSVKNGWKRGR